MHPYTVGTEATLKRDNQSNQSLVLEMTGIETSIGQQLRDDCHIPMADNVDSMPSTPC